MRRKLRNSLVLILGLSLSAGFSCGHKNILPDVSRIVIFSIPWSLDTIKAMSCEDLKASPNPVTVTDQSRIREFVSALAGAQLHERPSFKVIDARICCVLEDSSGNSVKEVSFSHTSLMQIDGKVYETDEALFKVVLSFLPVDYLET